MRWRKIVLWTTVRFITGLIHAPIRRLFDEQVPGDGRAACSEAVHWPQE